jgi:hypothetical protein
MKSQTYESTSPSEKALSIGKHAKKLWIAGGVANHNCHSFTHKVTNVSHLNTRSQMSVIYTQGHNCQSFTHKVTNEADNPQHDHRLSEA